MRKNSCFSVILLLHFIIAPFFISSCGPNDTKIKSAVETAINSNPAMTGITASVEKGVVTLSGECKDEASKSAAESEVTKVKGVKRVVNNCTIAPPPQTQSAPVTIAEDEVLVRNVNDAVKDYPGVKATVNNGVVTLTGDIKRADLQKLMMSLQSLHPKKVENQLTVK